LYNVYNNQLCYKSECLDLSGFPDYQMCVTANIEVNPDESSLAAVQGEETEVVSSTHSEADDDSVHPPIVMRPIRPVLPPSAGIEERWTILDVDNLLVLKSNVCCKYTKRR